MMGDLGNPHYNVAQEENEEERCEDCGKPLSSCACYQEEAEEGQHDDTPSLEDRGQFLGSYAS